MEVQVDQKVKLVFGPKEAKVEATVVRVFPKTVYLSVDSPKGKRIVKRKKHELS